VPLPYLAAGGLGLLLADLCLLLLLLPLDPFQRERHALPVEQVAAAQACALHHAPPDEVKRLFFLRWWWWQRRR